MIYTKSILNSIVKQVYGSDPRIFKPEVLSKIRGDKFSYFVMEDNMEPKIVNEMSDEEVISAGYIKVLKFKYDKKNEPDDGDFVYVNVDNIVSVYAMDKPPEGMDMLTVITCTGDDNYFMVYDLPDEVMRMILEVKKFRN